jgi:hypothetical protein
MGKHPQPRGRVVDVLLYQLTTGTESPGIVAIRVSDRVIVDVVTGFVPSEAALASSVNAVAKSTDFMDLSFLVSDALLNRRTLSRCCHHFREGSQDQVGVGLFRSAHDDKLQYEISLYHF